MHFEFLVEEASLESALTQLLPKILPSTVTFKIHAFRGKDDLKSFQVFCQGLLESIDSSQV